MFAYDICISKVTKLNLGNLRFAFDTIAVHCVVQLNVTLCHVSYFFDRSSVSVSLMSLLISLWLRLCTCVISLMLIPVWYVFVFNVLTVIYPSCSVMLDWWMRCFHRLSITSTCSVVWAFFGIYSTKKPPNGLIFMVAVWSTLFMSELWIF